MEIKLIASDMDGTLLDDDKRVPKENLRVLRQCADRGIQIVPATGRMARGLPEEVRALPGVRYAITINGAKVVDLMTGEVLSACCMPAAKAVEIMTMVKNSPYDVMYDAYVDGVGCTTQYFYDNIDRYVPSPGLAEMIKRSRNPVEDNISYIKDHADEVEKINLYFLDMEARAQIRKELEKVPGILVSSSIPNNLEINAAGADKGGALLRLAEHLGIAREETMAFGDGENDLTMLREAGLGVAMENGEEAVKAVSDFVTGNNNEAGVAMAIDRFVLK